MNNSSRKNYHAYIKREIEYRDFLKIPIQSCRNLKKIINFYQKHANKYKFPSVFNNARTHRNYFFTINWADNIF